MPHFEHFNISTQAEANRTEPNWTEPSWKPCQSRHHIIFITSIIATIFNDLIVNCQVKNRPKLQRNDDLSFNWIQILLRKSTAEKKWKFPICVINNAFNFIGFTDFNWKQTHGHGHACNQNIDSKKSVGMKSNNELDGFAKLEFIIVRKMYQIYHISEAIGWMDGWLVGEYNRLFSELHIYISA